MTEVRRRDALAFSLLALFPFALFSDVLLGRTCLYLRDLANFYHPAKKLLREIVLRGEFPYWNPFFSAGQPLAANPEHEVFYPLTWLILLPNYELAFHLLIVVHVSIALCAMYALLRSMDVGRPAAILGALSFGLGGLTLSMLNLLPILFSAAWMPLTCRFTRRYLRDNTRRDFALASFFLGIQLLIGEPATALQTGVLLGAYALWKKRARGVGAVALLSIAALLVAAVQVLPTLDHFRDSVRVHKLDIRRTGSWSMPFARLAELANPDFLGDPVADRPDAWRGGELYPDRFLPFYFSVYIGLAITAAALAGIITRKRGWVFALTMLAVSILLALGQHTPLHRLLYDLGVAGYFRYPEKFLLIGAFTAIVFGARMLDAILAGDTRLRVTMLAIVVLAIFAGSANWPRVAALALLLAFLPNLRRPLAIALLVAFAFIDLAPLLLRLAPRMPAAYYAEEPEIVKRFPKERDDFRIFQFGTWEARNPDAVHYFEPRPGRYWVFRNALAPMQPAAYRLCMVLQTDYDATSLLPTDDFARAVWALSKKQSRGWVDTVAAMSNIRYAVVFAPFARAYANAHGDMSRIQPARVIEGQPYPRYYFATQMVPITGRNDFVDKLASGRYSKQAAFVATSAFAPAAGVVRAWRESANRARIDVVAEGRAFLVMSVTPHKYWRVTIDGAPANAIITNLGYQGVEVPRGAHVVEMRYRNPLIAIGGAISIAALLALAGFTLLPRRDRA
ncbi:MAG TPA: hypothetical protein VJZ00_05140 [Thermoanaerobaculia bacterium]|nr:hypothetical protein [Thermoanaerobaculia bacterium]